MNFLTSETKHGMRIATRFFASILIAVVLFCACDMVYENLYWYGHSYTPRDYLGSGWDDFSITIITCAGVFLISLLLIWKMFKLKWRLITASSIAVFILGAFIFNSYQKSILELYETSEINLRYYEPFRENTLTKNLDEPASLSISENLPRLDGATALYPLYTAFARATYPIAEYKAYDQNSDITCSRTSGAFTKLLNGTVDLIFLMGVSEEQREQADELGLELLLTPIGKEAFIFFVNKQNSMSDLSVENIMNIYSGHITNWRDIGGENKEILVYQRPDTSGSQVMLKEIMGNVPIIEAPEENYYNEMMGMYSAVAYKNHRNALGYSFLYYIRDMIAEDEIKFLSIEGIEPTATNIASGAYPFAHDVYAITVVRHDTEDDDEGERIKNTEKLVKWILSPQGQSLVEKTGYVPLS